jgi:hypothetical protein
MIIVMVMRQIGGRDRAIRAALTAVLDRCQKRWQADGEANYTGRMCIFCRSFLRISRLSNYTATMMQSGHYCVGKR